jgi:hypothetical protein
MEFNMTQEEITLKLKIEDINLILEGLGNLPFVRVYNLVSSIQNQAATQLKTETSHPAINEISSIAEG